jgi:hypothetical protein
MMLERIEALFASGALMHPAREPATIVDLSRAIATLCGAEVDFTPAAASLRERIGGADHYVLVLIDGLGVSFIERQPAGAFLRSHVAGELASVYPSSTAPALTSLATGVWPGGHAISGWWTYLPHANITATILPFVERFGGRPAQQFAPERRDVFPQPSLLARMAVDVAVVQPQPISSSVYSTYFSGDRAQIGYETLSDAVTAIVDRIQRADGPTFTHFYVPFVDAAAHVHGPAAREVVRLVATADTAVADLHARLAGRARLVVTADHGATEIAGREILIAGDALMELLEFPPTGEPRAPYFHVRRGQERKFAAAFSARFGESFDLLSTEEAAAIGLFGPEVTAPARARIGNFVGVASGQDVIFYEPDESLRTMKGTHGGLTPDEVRIPLIVA